MGVEGGGLNGTSICVAGTYIHKHTQKYVHVNIRTYLLYIQCRGFCPCHLNVHTHIHGGYWMYVCVDVSVDECGCECE